MATLGVFQIVVLACCPAAAAALQILTALGEVPEALPEPRLEFQSRDALRLEDLDTTNTHRTSICDYLKATWNLAEKSESIEGCKAGDAFALACLRQRVPSDLIPNYFLTGRTTIVPEKSNVFFVHIPEVGVTPVETLLKRHLRPSHSTADMKRCWSLTKFATEQAPSASKPYFTYSVRSFGLHEFLPKTYPSAYVSWFRDPVERATSAFYYIKKKNADPAEFDMGGSHYEDHRGYAHVLRASSLRAYLEDVLAGVVIPTAEFSNHAVRLFNLGDFPDVDSSIWDGTVEITEKHYQVARDNLKRLFFIGLAEDQRCSIEQMCFAFGWQCSNETKTEMKLIEGLSDILENPEPTKAESDLLRKLLEWDIKLYEDARSVYEQQKSRRIAMVDAFNQQSLSTCVTNDYASSLMTTGDTDSI